MNQIATRDNFSIEEIELIKKTIATGATDHELSLFLGQCKRTGLDPFTKQIYFMKMGGKVTVMTSIDGLRLIAERSGQYDGQTTPLFCGEDGVWTETWFKKEKPWAAKVGVYKKGVANPFYAIALWSEYGKSTGVWSQYPTVMLSKTSESLALRKAFPNDMSGLSSDAEFIPQDTQSSRNVDGIKDVMKEVGWSKPDETVEKPKRTAKVQLAEAKAEVHEKRMSKNPTLDLGEYVVTVGLHKGRKLNECVLEGLQASYSGLSKKSNRSAEEEELLMALDAYLSAEPPPINQEEKID